MAYIEGFTPTPMPEPGPDPPKPGPEPIIPDGVPGD